MSSATTRSKPAAAPGTQASQDARRIAVAILDVLAGMRKPIEAAQALGVSLPRYYLLENRALEGMILACEPRSKGRQVSPVKQNDQLQKQVASLQRELARSQALARTTQRTIGLTMVRSSGPGGDNGRRRQRKPVVRALKAARQLSEPVESVGAPAASPGEPGGS